ncbi:MAG: TonB-dependent receptor [Balneolaceae bacterium]|nr:TonB-dependent receptor [Balneolaceae bacterium]MBO6547289.1 TonB-dependent receptor [Balneolaceae bacterium]MBO6647764.1 TonB-dependent receptor [Balneolaceae bacterium]
MCFVVLAAGTWSSEARQSASVNGYVKDSETGETLISANVAFLENNRGASTNTLGYFTITNVQAGTYTLAASYIGYKQYQREITLAAGENLRIDIELIPDFVQGEEIVVESEAEKEELKAIGTAQVKTELIKALPAIFEADVFRSIQYLPGVKAASDFSSGLYIRGGSPDQTLILLDRTTVYNPSHFFGFFSTFNPDAIKDVRLYKGGYPAEYGGRLGSVLSIYNKDGNSKEMSGTVTLGMLASRAAIEGPYKKGSYMFAVRRSTLEPLLAALRQNTDNIPSLFYFYDFNGKITFDASQNNKFSLAAYTGTDKVVFPFATDAEFILNYGNQTISGNWTHIFNEKLFSNFVLTGSRYFNFPEFEFGGTPFTRDNNIYDFSIKSDLEYLPNEKHQISTGIWSGVFTLKLQDRFDNQDSFSSRIQAKYTSFYVQDTWRPNDRWKVIGGIRANYFSDGDYMRIEPRLSVEHKLTERVRLQAAYGRYNQFFTLITNEAFSGFDIWLTSDEGINPAYGDQFVLGAKTIPFENYGLDVEVYYRTMEDLFELDPFLPDPAGLAYPDLFRIGTGYAYGMEVMFEKQVGRFNGFIGYTLGYTWRKFPGFNVAPGDGDNQARFYPPKYDRRNDVNLIMNYDLSRKWKVTSAWVYATGQAYTLALGRYARYDDPFSSGDPLDNFTVGKVNASRLPSYHRLDLSFSRKGRFFKIGASELQLQIINVYSRKNVWFQSFDFEENPVQRNDVNLLPILPTISYTVKF